MLDAISFFVWVDEILATQSTELWMRKILVKETPRRRRLITSSSFFPATFKGGWMRLFCRAVCAVGAFYGSCSSTLCFHPFLYPSAATAACGLPPCCVAFPSILKKKVQDLNEAKNFLRDQNLIFLFQKKEGGGCAPPHHALVSGERWWQWLLMGSGGGWGRHIHWIENDLCTEGGGG